MDAPTGFSRLQISLHWVIAFLILGQFLFRERIVKVVDALAQGGTTDITQALPHVIGGTAILALVIWRLVVRWRRGAPALPPEGNMVLDLIAKATHWLMYLLMLLIPVSGMAAWFGGVEAAADAHRAMFLSLAALVALHVLGAVYHQWIKKDGLIRRMMKAG